LKSAGIGFVIIQMHPGLETGMHPYRQILKNHRTFGKGLQIHRLSVPYPHGGGILRMHMHMAAGGNNALLQFHPARRALQHRAGGILHTAGQTHRRLDPFIEKVAANSEAIDNLKQLAFNATMGGKK
jgi:hypothetical protein